ncbi:CHC2 zinc finger domain-containing protein [Microbacterium lacticum]|uniref:CHC2 zinc finger domain-containing protein n=1 Tax=Microbacterium lacticum TaxID=33885 RepID=UPI001F5612C3|nr:CHC2 zinc finger domain-containing protein [Microbacterium lacticum]
MTLEYTGTKAATNSLDRIREALDRGGWKPRRRGNQYMALCPIHGDAQPSLSIRYDSAAGKVMVHCFGCGDAFHIQDLCGALGLTVGDLFDAPLPDDRRSRPGTPRPKRPSLPPRLTQDELGPSTPDLTGAKWAQVKVYEYVDDNGVAQQRVHREETTLDGKRHKRFTQSYRGANGRWVKRKPEGFTPVLYNLAAIRAAVAAHHDVWLLEGEKDADSAIAEGLAATTNAGGATAFPAELLEQFQGSTVNLVVDNDPAGAQRAVGVGAQLAELGIPARILLPDLDDRKADFTDHMDAGGTVASLVEISVDDARAIVAAAEADKLVHGRTGVAVCLKEATAQLEQTQQDRGTSEQHAEAWARESLNRLERVKAVDPDLQPEQLGDRGRAALAEYAAAVAEAVRISRDTYVIAGLDVPQAVASTIIAIRPDVDDQQPPETIEISPAMPPTQTGSGGGNGGVFFGNENPEDHPEKRPHIHGNDYKVVEGQTVLVKYIPSDDGKPEEKYYRILRGWAEVQTIAVEDDGTDSDYARPPHLYVIKFSRWVLNERGYPTRDKETGHYVTESLVLKYTEDQIRDGSWAVAMPWPGFLESTSRRGRDQAWDAINVISAPKNNSIVHTTVGWRTSDTGDYFVHATGAIAKGGEVDVEVDVAKTSDIYAMPAPTTDRDKLREAWIEGTLALRDSELPSRVIAPLLGHSWTAPVLPGPILLHLVGGFASYKTSHSRLAVQYFAPNLTHNTKGLISGASGGSTAIGLQRTLSAISYVPVIVDDFAPDGNASDAIRRISTLGRTVFNGIGRIRGKQRGGAEADRPILASIITSGELSAQGSADSRIVNLPLDPATLKNGGEIFGRLESRRSRHARALIGSSLVSWVAARRQQLVDDFTEAEEDSEHRLCTQAYWRKTIPNQNGHAGLHDRLVQSAVVLDRGIVIMLMMLRDLDVISDAEARDFYAWARAGIAEAISLQDSSASDPAEQLMEYLREAITNGSAHLAGMDGMVPDEASSLGWSDQSSGMTPQWRANGQRVGIIHKERLYLIPSTAIAVARQMSQRADEAFSDTKTSLSSSMLSHGWLIADGAGKRSAVRRTGRAMQQRVWDIPLSALTGTGPDNPSGEPGVGGGGEGPQNTPEGGIPALFDTPPVDETATAPETPAAAPTMPATPEQEAPAPAPAAAEAPAPQNTAAPRAATSPDEFRAPLGVLHTDGLWLPTGERINIRGQIQHAGQLAQLATDLNLGTRINQGTNGARKTERGQIFLTMDAALAIGLPLDTLPESTDSDYGKMLRETTKGHPFITMATDAGFSLSGDGSMTGSIDVWREDNRGVGAHIALIPAQDFRFISTILDADPDPATIARRLGKFTAALKFPYRSSAGTTGTKLMRALLPRDKQDEIYYPQDRPGPVKDQMMAEGDFNWQRKLYGAEVDQHWAHGFDRGGSYLAAASTEVGVGAPTHYEGPLQFTKAISKPGYWLITAPEPGSWLMPDIFSAQGITREGFAGTRIWVTTPTLELASEMGLDLEVHEAWLWDRKAKVFEAWYKRIRDARSILDTDDEDDQAARDLLKIVYAAAIGMLDYRGNHDTLAVWAPHRHDMIVAKSRANIIRRVLANAELSGRWPVAIEKDTIVYTSDSNDPLEAWPGDPAWYGRGLGQYKYEGSDQLTHHAEFLTGDGSYKGKKYLEELI